MIPDFATYSDADLKALRLAVIAEEARRTVIRDAPKRADDLAREVLAAEGRKEGQTWVQPTGAHDAIPLGWKVQHNGKTWESLIPGNVWKPGDTSDPQSYRWWKDLTPVADVTAWDPNGKPYKVGDVVTHYGLTYSCRQPHTSQAGWSPTVAASLWLLKV